MNTLLKDLPEHKERIEYNFSLKKDIISVIGNNSDYSTTMETVVLKEPYFECTAEEIVEKIIAFVNENYEWKGIKA